MDWKTWLKLGAIAALLAFAVYSDIDCGCDPCDRENYWPVDKTDTLTEDSWYLELRGENANKDCHGKFELTVYWANEDHRADYAQESPYSDSTDMRMDFRTPQGSFTVFQIPPQRLVVPAGEDTVIKWQWKMSVGAKNELSNPTTYIIQCSAPGLDYIQPPPGKPADWWHVIVEASIDYVEYDPLEQKLRR
jgi:hypothetical protein